MMIVFSVVTLCTVANGRCLDVHVPHPEHTIETCEAMMRRDAPIAVEDYNANVEPNLKVQLGGYRCQMEPSGPRYTSEH